MRVRLHALVVVLETTFRATPIAIYAQDANLPHLEKRDGTTQLIVDGKPFLMLGGELFNSSAVFSDATRDADARAFAAVMEHIREVDSRDHTVIMMQVENEVGILGDARDHSAAADQALASAVPSQLINYIKAHRDTIDPELRSLWLKQGEKTSGTWGQVFGDTVRADEIFMAWNYARYVQSVILP
jgi:hypothetical protein